MHDPIHDGIGHRSLAKALIPSGNGKLGRDDERSVLHSVIEEIKDLFGTNRWHRGDPPVIEYEQMGLCHA